ncbi:SWIM zinc finger family protein [Microtetraspora sp. NBRC 16547]|uniref:SWIM zinc finger family protein n=1 Tax=Microtetraspora sp. NBRC 16547 TaxID=3030993 RepID=UPI00255775B7|nr:SWIM zinc finger family protein [Microtetraspora sp. NBRC 16547]
MIERWSRDQVLALAPDAASQKAATGVSSPGKWSALGVTPEVLWGECKGSGSKPYRACVDLSEPAYRCSCPSRKFPCKHSLGLLLLWSADGVPAAEEPADWVAEWLDQRRDRALKQASRLTAAQEAAVRETAAQRGAPAGTAGPDGRAHGDDGDGAAGSGGPGGSGRPDRRAQQREQRVTAGLSELERWLADQIAQGVAGARQTGPADWDAIAKRMVDAQAPGVAGMFTRLSGVLREEEWPGRLLGEYALVHLLAVAHRRTAELPSALGDVVRSRIGFPLARETVLASPAVRDRWDVIGSRDEEQDRLIARRVWLRGRETGRAALVLSFAPVGQALDASLVSGTTVDADLAFYPGSAPLRALVARRHGAVQAGPPPGLSAARIPGLLAGVLAGDPWTESWPVVLSGVVPANDGGWLLADPGPLDSGPLDSGPLDSGPDLVPEVSGLRLDSSIGTPWRLLAVSGGHPVTVACEWTPRGLRPLTTWDEEGKVVVL